MKGFILSLLLFSTFSAFAQNNDLPVTLLTGSDTSKPIILYISGDGGWNNFSESLIRGLNKNGYTVAGINAKNYFWDKKTPQETAIAITTYLARLTAAKPNRQFVFAGYSFGADVLPFIINSLSPVFASRVKSAVLLSPSTSTDFEIHWTDLVGWNKKRNMDVIAAINQLHVAKTLAIFGDDEKEFPFDKVHLINFSHQILPGGHHFDGDVDTVVKTILDGI